MTFCSRRPIPEKGRMAKEAGIKIAPSLLAADFSRLGDEIKKVEDAGADWLHVDVMDGHFVPNITLGPFIVEAMKRSARIPLDVHLMIEKPADYAKNFIDAGADILTFHIEAMDSPIELFEMIKGEGVKAGVSLSPDTDIDESEEVYRLVDKVLIMTVHPGFGGQGFIKEMLPKIAKMRRLIGAEKDLQIDGGVNFETLADAASAGTNVIVAGTSIFGSDDVKDMIKRLRDIGERNFNANPAAQ